MEEMIANCYSRAYAATISTNDPGLLPEAEAQKAVLGMAKMMVMTQAPKDTFYWKRVIENIEGDSGL